LSEPIFVSISGGRSCFILIGMMQSFLSIWAPFSPTHACLCIERLDGGYGRAFQYSLMNDAMLRRIYSFVCMPALGLVWYGNGPSHQ
jgi:hypothetical protein